MRLTEQDRRALLAAEIRCEAAAGESAQRAASFAARAGECDPADAHLYRAAATAAAADAEQLCRAVSLIRSLRAKPVSSPRRKPGITTPPATAGGSL